MPDLKVVSVELRALNAKFNAAMKDSSAESSNFGKVTTVALAAGATALAAFGKKSVDTYLEVGKESMKLSRITGENIETASKFRFAGQQSGMSADQLANSIKFLSKNMAAGKEIFGELGIATKDASGHLRGAHDVFLDSAEAIKKMANATERNDAAQKLFGRSGMDLLPMLMKGKQGIIDLENEAQKYGLVLTKDNAAAIAENIKAHRQLDAAMQGLQVSIGQNVLPMLTDVTSFLAGATQATQGWIAPVAGITAGLIGLALVGPPVINMFTALTSGMTGVGAAASGGALVGIALMVAAIAKMKADSKEFSTAMFKDIDFSSFDDNRRSLNAAGISLRDMSREWSNYSTAEKVAHVTEGKDLRDAVEQYKENTLHLQAMQQGYNGIAREMGLTTGQAKALAEKAHIDPTQLGWDKLQPILQQLSNGEITAAEASVQFTSALSAQSDGSDDVTASIEQQTKATKELNDAEKALFDPQFAMLDAVKKQKEAREKATAADYAVIQAQLEYNTAVRNYGSFGHYASDAALKLADAQATQKDAAVDVGRATVDLDVAVRNLETAYKTGAVSIEDTKVTLDGWVQSGIITAAQADIMRQKLDGAKAAADNLNGTTATVTVMTVQDYYQTPAMKQYFQSGQYGADMDAGRAHGHALGGNLDEGWNLVGEQGPEAIYKSGGQASVMTAGNTSKMLAHNAALAGGSSAPVHNHYAVSVTVQGSVKTERDLVAAVGEGLRRQTRSRKGVGGE